MSIGEKIKTEIRYSDISKLSESQIEAMILEGMAFNLKIVINSRVDVKAFRNVRNRMGEKLDSKEKKERLTAYCFENGI